MNSTSDSNATAAINISTAIQASGVRATSNLEPPSSTPKSVTNVSIHHYVAIARPDHWVKNVFMLLGTGVVLVVHPQFLHWGLLPSLVWATLSACLVASSNYVLNEILDAKFDRNHPEKQLRPMASGLIPRGAAFTEWILVGALGLGLAWTINLPFFLSALSLWIMGLIYNVPPLRSKEVPVVDVLSEAINNPIRFLLGWYAVGYLTFPPSSILMAYWMLGAFFMAGKRTAEYREIAGRCDAAKYRKSFAWYTEDRLVVSMLSYASGFMFFFAVIMTKHHPELILSAPFLIILMGYVTKLVFEPDSIVQHPEHLLRQPWFLAYGCLCLAVLFVLSLVSIPGVRVFLGLEGPHW